MRNLFRSFERFGVRYLLISGQASVLYGAATFSEDVDLWIDPTRSNIERCVRALAACRARVYKLTPPLAARHVRSGHGFHFTVPSADEQVYLDIMGKPPRVGPFARAWRHRRLFDSAWGRLPVVSLRDLIALKKTRRLYDYEVISNLVRILVAEAPVSTRPLLRWAADATFRAEDRQAYLLHSGLRASLDQCRRRIASEMRRLQDSDTRYWSRRIDELRRLRAKQALLPEGILVTPGILRATPPAR